MSNCKITIQIINYEFFNKNFENTLEIPFDKFICFFKYELNSIGQINLNSLQDEMITHSLKNVTKDLKYNVLINNSIDNDLVGVFDIIIPFSFIKNINPSTTLELTKNYSLTMLDSTKRKLFGSIINATDIIFTIHASIDVISKMKSNRSFIISDYKKNNLISLNNNNINTSYNNSTYKEKNHISSKNTLKHTISFTNKTLNNNNNNKRINTLPNKENILSPNGKKNSFRTKLLIDNDDIFLSNKFNYIKTPPTEKKNKNFIFEKTNNMNSSFNNTSTNISKYNNSSYKKNNYKNFMNNTLNYSHRESIKSKLNKKLNINKKENNNNRFIKSARSSLCNNNKKKLLNSNSFYQKPLKYNIDNYLSNNNNNKNNNNNNKIKDNINNINISNFIYKKAKSRQIPQINNQNNNQNFSTLEERQNFSNPNLESILNNKMNISNSNNSLSKNSINNTSIEDKKEFSEEFIDPNDTSTIQSELIENKNNNNNNDNENKIDNEIYLIKNTFLSNNINFDEENESNGLHKNIQEIKDKILLNLKLLLKYQDLIKNKILSVQNKNNNLKQILFKNQDKYQLICKKYRELITLEQKNDDKNFIVVKKNSINDITKNLINSKKLETDIFKTFFDLTELQNYFNKYYLDDKNKLKLLLNCIKSFIENFGNISRAYGEDEDSRIRLKAVLFRYNINEKEIKDENEDDNLNNNINNNKIIINNEINNIKAIKEVDEDKEEDDDEENEENSIDEINKIEKLIQEFESKNSNIKLNKINDYEYKFGNQKFKIKLENEEIYVQFGNEYLKIEKYFEKIVNNDNNNTNNSFLSSNKRNSVKGKINNNINGGNYLGKNSKNNSKKITSNNSFRKSNSEKK